VGKRLASGDRRLREPTPVAAIRRRAIESTDMETTQDEQRRHGNNGVDEDEKRNDGQGGQEWIALSSGGEPLAARTGGGGRMHRLEGVVMASSGERVRAEARDVGVVGDEPSVLFVRLVPNKQTKRFNTYGPSSRDVNARRTENHCEGRR
jgi:hypothetical protein